MMGIGPTEAAQFMVEAGADILGVNCGAGVDVEWATKAVQAYREISDRPTMAQPNAGTPELIDMQVVYRQTPDEMCAKVPELIAAGANIVGGCCGSTPAHLQKFRSILN